MGISHDGTRLGSLHRSGDRITKGGSGLRSVPFWRIEDTILADCCTEDKVQLLVARQKTSSAALNGVNSAE
jgi:hypothetical protein